jgi:hypothetical protein
MATTYRKRLRNRKYRTVAHKQAKKEARALVDAGLARCSRCGEMIEPGAAVDVGHDDRYPWLHAGPEHPGCNRGAPHRNSVSREW